MLEVVEKLVDRVGNREKLFIAINKNNWFKMKVQRRLNISLVDANGNPIWKSNDNKEICVEVIWAPKTRICSCYLITSKTSVFFRVLMRQTVNSNASALCCQVVVDLNQKIRIWKAFLCNYFKFISELNSQKHLFLREFHFFLSCFYFCLKYKKGSLVEDIWALTFSFPRLSLEITRNRSLGSFTILLSLTTH